MSVETELVRPSPAIAAQLSPLSPAARLAEQHVVVYASLGGRASPSWSVAGA